jgi:hypothetical protein
VREVRSEIEIDAPPESVWRVLTDFAAYPDWNPFIRRIEGSPTEGSQLRVRIEPPGGRGMTFKPTVLAAEPNRELRWLGRVVLPKIFDGEHRFTLEPAGEGRTRLAQSEAFSGVLVPILGRMLSATVHGFEEMNQALKARVESASPSTQPS